MSLYPIVWAAHLSLGFAALTGALLPNDPERPLVLAWCALIVVVIPAALASQGRTQMIEVSEDSISITGSFRPFRPRIAIPRSKAIRLHLYSGGWGACHLLVLHWGRLPWQSVSLASFASTDAKRSIGENIAAFLGEHQIDFTTNLLGPGS